VTTPRGSRARGFWIDTGMSSHTVVRFNHRSETSSKQLLSWLAPADVWYARAFTQGSLPWNLQTRLSCQCAKELPIHSFERTHKWKVFLRLRAARLSSPCVNAGAFRRGLVRTFLSQWGFVVVAFCMMHFGSRQKYGKCCFAEGKMKKAMKNASRLAWAALPTLACLKKRLLIGVDLAIPALIHQSHLLTIALGEHPEHSPAC
jgi:hypothetical protein